MGAGFRKIDIYGQNLTLSYRGDENFKTTPGAIASLSVILVLLAYAGFKSYVLFNRVNPNTSKSGFIRDLDVEDVFRPALDYGFDLAFSIG